ncbi:MAG: SDR family NAD(P)-dependent oxidoreductase [Saprospiraceae bacterium]|nr:SDR family NAD(P)-dependent oxidoreductase [Saprospiraceae bacterium]
MKSIIVTGAAGNLGQEVVKKLLAGSNRVHAALGLGENSRIFNDTMHNGLLSTQFVNLTDETVAEGFVKDALAQDPGINTAILLVGGWEPGDIHETTRYEFEKMFNLNFYTAYNVARPLMSYFEQKGEGQFVFISARPAINPSEAKNSLAYAFSKSLLLRLAETINDEGKFRNIRANVIVPSTLDTPAGRDIMPGADYDQWVKPEHVAELIMFLLSEAGQDMKESILKMYNEA